MKIEITAVLDYDDALMHGNDPEAIDWFWNMIYGDDLVMCEVNEIGDTIGKLEILSIGSYKE